MKTDTTQYEASHGKKPRGYGFWFFEVIGVDEDGNRFPEVIPASGCMADAREQAVADFNLGAGEQMKLEVVEVVVLP